MSQPRLPLFLFLVLVLEGTTGSFLRPLTCNQDISDRKTCGGEAESFYPHQCLQKKCCYRNHTCYHHVIDGPRQRRNAGIIGGTSTVVVILSMCIFFSCKFKEFQRKEKESESIRSEGEMADYLVKLLDEESEPDDYRRPESSDQGYSWTPGSFSQPPAWSPGSQEASRGMGQPPWSPEQSPQPSSGPMLPEPPPVLALAPPPAPEPMPTLAPAPLPASTPAAPLALAPAPAPPVPAPAPVPAAGPPPPAVAPPPPPEAAPPAPPALPPPPSAAPPPDKPPAPPSGPLPAPPAGPPPAPALTLPPDVPAASFPGPVPPTHPPVPPPP